MPNDLLTPPELDPRDSKSASLHTHPQQGSPSSDHLGIGGGLQEEGIFASLWTNLHDAFFPPKLPPLVLTSKPIAVPDRMKVKRSPASTATAVVVHALLILLIGWLLATKVIHIAAPTHVATTVDLGTPPIAPLAAKAMGGGGGNHDIAPVSKGRIPPPQKIQVAVQKPLIEQPKIPMPPSLDLQKNLKLPNTNMPNFGDPSAPKVAGPGSLGNGDGGGIGPGKGNGFGPGTGGNTGGGDVYSVGGGVSAPVGIYTPEAEFSDEARRAKYQGDVDVICIVGADGLVHNPHVQRDPGMGLAQKALDTVKTYRFKPAMKDGKPVAVRIIVEVGFTIY